MPKMGVFAKTFMSSIWWRRTEILDGLTGFAMKFSFITTFHGDQAVLIPTITILAGRCECAKCDGDVRAYLIGLDFWTWLCGFQIEFGDKA